MTKQLCFDFELDPLLRWIDELDVPVQMQRLLIALAIWGCSNPSRVVDPTDNGNGEWLLDPSIDELARVSGRSRSAVKGWLVALDKSPLDCLSVDRSDRMRHLFRVDWREIERLATGRPDTVTSEVDPGQIPNLNPVKFQNRPRSNSKIDPGQIPKLTPVNSGSVFYKRVERVSDSLSFPDLPAAAWEKSRTGPSLAAVIRDWWRQHNLGERCTDPDSVAGAILAARELAQGDPQIYFQMAMSNGVREHWIARGRQLRKGADALPYAPHGTPK